MLVNEVNLFIKAVLSEVAETANTNKAKTTIAFIFNFVILGLFVKLGGGGTLV